MSEPFFATVNEDGILEIPKEILDEYGWELGTELDIEVLDNGNIKLSLHTPPSEDQWPPKYFSALAETLNTK